MRMYIAIPIVHHPSITLSIIMVTLVWTKGTSFLIDLTFNMCYNYFHDSDTIVGETLKGRSTLRQ
ncbi:hypothetical protein BDV38DRAFT_243547 [Aspergillus pseudotamarii]|uniref:Uncharacterized protein n=1 Tax=Aspergillus pseudotamarii TaxID=132259 RepID=A0A5N6SWL7_ASPPS|nr:uncharacterized protein BDV38DRAFT_243547 [Aspergillus pseudotamarii]KAE8139076.1 hypothetical protein BDV38DRAFT_243547 [Aspergillus pseudotamarii]